MDLQLSVFLLFILFTAGHSLSCYECMSPTGSCAEQTVKTCPIGYSQCMSLTTERQVGDITFKVKAKDCAVTCQSWSMNFGFARTTSSCCDTNKCNAQDAPDPIPNGKKCYFCDDKSCSNKLSCLGTEDRCIKATGTFEGQSWVFKGCVSSIFDATTSISVQSFSSCEGNLCNGAQSVTQSFLFLCCSLLSYFMMH
ncbi:hypothetical protein PO909_007702 [Leuciscus waleckii]